MKTREQFSSELFAYVESAVANGEALIVENQAYKAHIQRGSDLIAQGITEVYNKLENVTEPVKADGYVITGAVGEQWCIKEKNLKKYGVSAEENPPEGMISVSELPTEGKDVMTIPDGVTLIAIHIPREMTGEVITSWASLKINSGEDKDGNAIPHGDGDYILINAVINQDNKTVNIDYDNGDARVVNGEIFHTLYRQVDKEKSLTLANDKNNSQPKQKETNKHKNSHSGFDER